MKNFSQFLNEARETSASAEAKRLGLTGDGHGGWYDKNGEFVAKTVGGKLKFFGSDNTPGKKDSPSQPQPQPQEVQQTQQVPVQEPTQQTQQQATPEQQPTSQEVPAEMPVPETPGVVVVFGRFNPPTIGHQKLLDRAAKEANKRGYELRIYPSRSQDAKKNPLTPQMKISYMRQMFPDYSDNIIDDKGSKTIFNVLTGANGEGHKNMIIMVGQDRLGEFQGLSHKYNGELYNYDQLEVVSAGDRDPDSDDVTGMSASKLRLAAAEGDFKKFSKGVPDTLGNMEKMELFNVLRRSMNITENTEIWEVAPKLDGEGLRDAYISEELYPIGMRVENLNTGLSGEIIRRGTNYVICLTENNLMFKSWLRDIKEYTEVKMDSMYRAPGKPNTLVGTLGAFKYYASMTPGVIGTGKENLQPGGNPYGVEFIQRFRKSKVNK
jgi:cytidyltransferase-like protein